MTIKRPSRPGDDRRERRARPTTTSGARSAYHCYAGDPFTPLQQALDDSPRFVMAHVLKRLVTLVGANAEVRGHGRRGLSRRAGTCR